jgi:hypothetical protein
MTTRGVLRAITGRKLVLALLALSVASACSSDSDLALGGEHVATATEPLVWTEWQKLTALDGAQTDVFGISVAVQGSTAIVGAFAADIGGNAQQGAAYVFGRSAMDWTQLQKLTTTGSAGDSFGTSVALDGDVAVVSAETADVAASANQGAAYVFARAASTWTEQQKLTASDGAANDQLGWSVAVHGTTVLLGASYHDQGANADQGAAYVFVRSASTWTEQQKLTASDGAASDFFGWSVSVYDDTAVVGADYHDVAGHGDQGAAYVFVRSATTWTQQQQLTAADGTISDRFGSAVAVHGDTAVAGATLHDVGAVDQGSAYVFVRSASLWTQQQQLAASDGAANDRFGTSVAIYGDRAIVGAQFDDVGGIPDQGSAYVFVRSASLWAQQQQLTASDGAANDEAAGSVALDGDTAVVAAAYADIGSNTEQGAAYVFSFVKNDGEPCAHEWDCEHRFCVDGVCCHTACDGLCVACSQVKTGGPDGTCSFVSQATDPDLDCPGPPDDAYVCDGAGTCKKANGVGCAGPGECAGALCVDGFCCDSACDGLCEACTHDKTGQPNGSCAPVSAGSDLDNECAPDPSYPQSCGADGTCDGAGSCRTHAPPALVECGQPSCEGHQSYAAPMCAATGPCPAVGQPAADCAPYQCNGQACAITCTTSAQCVPPAVCDGEHCIIETSCDGDHTLVTSTTDGGTTDCTPYRCTNDGLPSCLTSCASGADCVSGYSCGADGRCLPAADLGNPDENGGCGCRLATSAADGRGSGRWALAAALVVLGRRPRRSRQTKATARSACAPAWSPSPPV